MRDPLDEIEYAITRLSARAEREDDLQLWRASQRMVNALAATRRGCNLPRPSLATAQMEGRA